MKVIHYYNNGSATKVIHYYRYHSNVAERYGLPLAEIVHSYHTDVETFMSSRWNMSKISRAQKVWVKVGDEPIKVLKCREGNMKFDEEEFAQMLFVAEVAGPVSLGA